MKKLSLDEARRLSETGTKIRGSNGQELDFERLARARDQSALHVLLRKIVSVLETWVAKPAAPPAPIQVAAPVVNVAPAEVHVAAAQIKPAAPVTYVFELKRNYNGELTQIIAKPQ